MGERVLQLEELPKKYCEKVALDGVSFDVPGRLWPWTRRPGMKRRKNRDAVRKTPGTPHFLPCRPTPTYALHEFGTL